MITLAQWQDMKSLPEKYRIVAESIRVGKRNATLLSDIMMIADIKDRRQAYIIIEDLINKYGYVIGASKKGKHRGYYIPANEKEFKEVAEHFKLSVDSMNNRYMNLLKNYSVLIYEKYEKPI